MCAVTAFQPLWACDTTKWSNVNLDQPTHVTYALCIWDLGSDIVTHHKEVALHNRKLWVMTTNSNLLAPSLLVDTEVDGVCFIMVFKTAAAVVASGISFNVSSVAWPWDCNDWRWLLELAPSLHFAATLVFLCLWVWVVSIPNKMFFAIWEVSSILPEIMIRNSCHAALLPMFNNVLEITYLNSRYTFCL